MRMKLLVAIMPLLACVAAKSHRGHYVAAAAPVGHDGRVVDTPEVAQAKAAHLAAYSRLASRPTRQYHAEATQPLADYSNPGFFSSRIQHGAYGYHGPPAPLANDGRVLDTPEVAHAKAAHLAAYGEAASRSYDGPASYSEASDEDYEAGAYREENEASGSSEGLYEGQALYGPYQGPAAPLDDLGRVVDTPEVAQAKAAHLAALRTASQRQRAGPYDD